MDTAKCGFNHGYNALSDSMQMDALVHDLSEALKDSSCSSRVKVGFRRRTRSAGNIALLGSKATHSDDSISERLQSCGKERDHGQSDSDEVSANSMRRPAPFHLKKRTPHSHLEASYLESDSVNENFSPLKTDRRKRKMKRMDCESVPSGETLTNSAPRSLFPGPAPVIVPKSLGFDASRVISLPGPSGIRVSGKKKKPPKDLIMLDGVIGKRKRSSRERPEVLGGMAGPAARTSRILRTHMPDQMELDREIASSSSLSSSESDPGIMTNDEGREGDDEQSDWFADPRPDEETDLEPDDPTFHSVFHGNLEHMTNEARQAYAERIEWLRDGLGEREREIRGGRRRVHDDRPAFSINTSANEKLAMFLQDCQQITLKLHAMESNEIEQLAHLVKMYSLRMRLEVAICGHRPILTKTSLTPKTIKVDPTNLHGSAQKKRRKLPLAGSGSAADMVWETPPLPRQHE